MEEQIGYVQSLWDRIAANADQVPLHEWQARTLEARLAAHRASPSDARSWEEVLDRLEHRIKHTATK
jgi:putative addiction module component (TIGR02574 family)